MSMPTIIFLVALTLAIAFALALAYVPMRLLISQMAKNVQQFIQRQRDRRALARDTPDRRKVI
jgi:flagellar biogenesis protein FliO